MNKNPARRVRSGKLLGLRASRRRTLTPQAKCKAFLSAYQAASGAPVGSPQRWLPLVGTLTPKEAEQLRASVREFDKWHEGLD